MALESKCQYAEEIVNNIQECKAKYKCLHVIYSDQVPLCGLYFKNIIAREETQRTRGELKGYGKS